MSFVEILFLLCPFSEGPVPLYCSLSICTTSNLYCGSTIPLLFCLQIDPSGEIIMLDTPCPWTDHLFALEKSDNDNGSSIKYVLYKEQESNKWRVQAVPLQPDSFQSRLLSFNFYVIVFLNNAPDVVCKASITAGH